MQQSITLEGDPATDVLDVDLAGDVPELDRLAGMLPPGSQIVQLSGDFIPDVEINGDDSDFISGDFVVDSIGYLNGDDDGELGFAWARLLRFRAPAIRMPIRMPRMPRMPQFRAPRIKLNARLPKVNMKASMKGLQNVGKKLGDLQKQGFDSLVSNPLQQAGQLAQTAVGTVGNVAQTAIGTAGNLIQTGVQTAGQVAQTALQSAGGLASSMMPQQSQQTGQEDPSQSQEEAPEQEDDMQQEDMESPDSIEAIEGDYHLVNDDLAEIVPHTVHTFSGELAGPGDKVRIMPHHLQRFAASVGVMRKHGIPLQGLKFGPRGGFVVPRMHGDPEAVMIRPDQTTLAGELGFSLFPDPGKKNKKKMMMMNALALSSRNPELIKTVAMLNVKKSIDNKKKRKKQNNLVKNVGMAAAGGAALVATGGLAALPALASGVAGAASAYGTAGIMALSSALGPAMSAAGPILKTIGASGLQQFSSILGPDGVKKVGDALGSGGLGEVIGALGSEASKLGTPEGVQRLMDGINQGKTDPDDLSQYLQQSLANVPQPPADMANITTDANGQQVIEISKPTARTVTPAAPRFGLEAKAGSGDMLMILGAGIVLFMLNKKK